MCFVRYVVKLFLLIVLMSGSVQINSQPTTSSAKIDSLSNELNQTTNREDSIEILANLGYEFWTVDPQVSIKYGRKALELATREENSFWIAFSFRVLGVAYWVMGEYPLALQNMLEALGIYQELGNKEGVANMFLNLSLIYADDLNPELAKQYYRRSIKIYDEIKKRERVATASNKLARILIVQDSLSGVDRMLTEALQIHSSNGFQYGISETENVFGKLYCKQRKFDSAENNLKKSLHISTTINDQDGIARGYIDLGLMYTQMGNLNLSRSYYDSAKNVSKALHLKKWRLKALKGLYEVQSFQSKLEEGGRLFTQCIDTC